MSILLQIIGTGLQVDVADLVWHWFDVSGAAEKTNDESRAEQLHNIINLARQHKDQTACEQLRLYLFDNPSCVLGRMTAGALSIQMNHLKDAVEEFKSVYSRQPSNTMNLYALGYCYERLENESEAVAFYQDCLKFKNHLQLPRQRLSAIYFKNQRLEDAIHEYELLRSEYPDDIKNLVALGNLYILAEKYDRAIDTFNTAILIHPDNFVFEDSQVDEFMRAGNFYDALEYIDQNNQDQIENPHILVKKADLFSMTGETANAVACYEQALRICPDLIEATIKLGTQYLQQQKDQLAALFFNKAFEMNDRVVDAYMGLVTAQKLSGKKSEANATLSLAAAIQPNSALLFAQTATLRFRANSSSYDEAYATEQTFSDIGDIIKAYQSQLSLEPQNPHLHYLLGILLMSVSQLDEASKAFNQCLDINPTFDRARAKMIVCLYETKKTKDALELLTEPLPLNADCLNLHYKTALLYCDRAKFASSLLNLERFMEDNLASIETTHNISIILQNLGLLDRTVATWESLTDAVARSVPNDPFGPQDTF